MYVGFLVLWVSRLQTEIALSTTELECMELSQLMRDFIPLIILFSEIALGFPIYRPKPKAQCTVFEDNTSCITIAKAPNMTPRTKYIALKYHNFRNFVQRDIIDIQYIDTKE